MYYIFYAKFEIFEIIEMFEMFDIYIERNKTKNEVQNWKYITHIFLTWRSVQNIFLEMSPTNIFPIKVKNKSQIFLKSQTFQTFQISKILNISKISKISKIVKIATNLFKI